jgi:hypothetical protein
MENTVNHPTHYTDSSMAYVPAECIHITRHLPFDLGNAVKYIWRAGKKGDVVKSVEDLCKAAWYIEDACKNNLNTDNCVAISLFDLLVVPGLDSGIECYRYSAIECIVNGYLKNAYEGIFGMLNMLLKQDIAQEARNRIRSILVASEPVSNAFRKHSMKCRYPSLKEVYSGK